MADNDPNSSALTSVDDSTQLCDDDFIDLVKEQTSRRRHQQDTAVADLRIGVERLAAALQASARRRVDSVAAIELKCQERLADVEQRLVTRMREDRAAIEERLAVIEQRLVALEGQVDRDVPVLMESIAAKGENLVTQIARVREELAAERQAQVDRQAEWTAQLQQVSDDYEERWTMERQERLASVGQLQARMDDGDRVKDEQVRALEAKIRAELTLLEQDLEREAGERRVHDEDIVHGLNRYIQQVQKSLAYASGV